MRVSLKMNILIISADNLYLTPYINFYISILNQLNINYKVIYWDKNDNEHLDNNNYIRFFSKGKSKLNKILGYFKFRIFCKKQIKKSNFECIIPLHTVISFILFDQFIFCFKNKYIYDIRDYSYEKFFIFKFTQKLLINNSLINIISSKGYKEFLPLGEYFCVHNRPYNNYINYRQYESKNNSVLHISYIGLIRFMEQNKKVILFFKNDNRFHLNFIGTNATHLKDFCEKNEVNNVTLIDTFDNNQTLDYYNKADLIMNLYGNNNPLLDYALSNKLYYAACLYKPILVCEQTFMEKITKKYNIGFTLKMKSKDEKDALYEYAIHLDRKKFIDDCELFMEDVYKDESELLRELTKRLKFIKEEQKNND